MGKMLTASDVQRHSNRKSLWIVIKNDVYDVTSFLGQHPGGEDPLLEAGGKDATSAFDDVGHSASARKMLSKYKVGSLVPGEKCGGSSKAAGCSDDEKSWRKRFKTKKSVKRSNSKSPIPNEGHTGPSIPRAIPRVPSILVPRQRRPRGEPCVDRGGMWKWILLALAAAVVAGVVFQKLK